MILYRWIDIQSQNHKFYIMAFTFIKLKELEEFSSSLSNLEGANVAITPWRALSQANNPHADPEDVVMVFKRNEKAQICGYIGSLPFRLEKQNSEKFGWISGWRVEAYAEKGLSQDLLKIFITNYDGKIMFSEIPSAKLVERIKTLVPVIAKEREGLHIWLRFNIAEKLISYQDRKKRFYKLIKISRVYYLIFIFERLINLILYPLYYLTSIFNESNKIQIEKIDYPDEEDYKFIYQNSGNDVYTPTKRELKWINDFPWLIKRDKLNEDIGLKYFFSSFADKNEVYWLRIRKEHSIVGMICLSVRDGVVKTQYVYLLPEEEEKICRKILSYLLKQYNFHDIITYHKAFVNLLNKTFFPCIRKKKGLKRYYGVSQKLIAYTGPDFTMQDGTGDYIFT